MENKQLIAQVCSALEQGDDGPFLEAMAEDMCWTWMGTGAWSKTFEGKTAVVGELWAAVKSTLAPPYKLQVHQILAEGDQVVIEAVGQNTTPDGRPYHNQYCWVCTLAGGKICSIREYMDTELVTKTFKDNTPGPPTTLYQVIFGTTRVLLDLKSETQLAFTILEKDGQPCHETQEVWYYKSEIAPHQYLISWSEPNRHQVTQFHDWNTGILVSHWTSPDGSNKSVQGSIVPLLY
jgi:hypothetical protein